MWVLSVPFFAYVLYRPLRILLSGTAILITDLGLVDRTMGLGFISWDEIRSATVRRSVGLDLVALDLTDLDAVLSRFPAHERVLWRYYVKKNGYGPTLAACFVEGGATLLMQLIKERAQGAASHKAV